MGFKEILHVRIVPMQKVNEMGKFKLQYILRLHRIISLKVEKLYRKDVTMVMLFVLLCMQHHFDK